MVAPQDPQRGRAERAATFSTCALADIPEASSRNTAIISRDLDRITMLLSPGSKDFPHPAISVYTRLQKPVGKYSSRGRDAEGGQGTGEAGVCLDRFFGLGV